MCRSRISELKDIVLTFDDLKPLDIRVEPAHGVEELNADSRIVQMDLDRLVVDLGKAVVTVFGKTEFGEWTYFATTYDKADRPVAPGLSAKYEAADRMIAYIRDQKARWAA